MAVVKWSVLGVVGILLQAEVSVAADMPVRIREPVKVANWTGFYVGAHAGYQTGRVSGLLPAEPLGGLGNTLFNIIDPIFQGIDPFGTVDPLSVFATRNANFQGPVAGGHFGYDYQHGHVVVGAFTSASWTGASYSETAGLSASLAVVNLLPIANVDVTATGLSSIKKDFEARLGGRAGLAFDRLLVYGTGGLAMAHVKYVLQNDLNINVSALAPVVGSASATLSTSASQSRVHAGFFFGAGAEMMIARHWSLSVEWMRTSYASVAYQTQTNLNVTASAALNLVGTSVTVTLPGQTKIAISNEDDARVKLNYRF